MPRAPGCRPCSTASRSGLTHDAGDRRSARRARRPRGQCLDPARRPGPASGRRRYRLAVPAYVAPWILPAGRCHRQCAGGRLAGLRPQAGHGVRRGLRTRLVVLERVDGVLRHAQQGRQHLPAELDRCRLVEVRRGVALRRQRALHRRLQLGLPVHLRASRDLLAILLVLLVQLRTIVVVRPAPGLLQRLPLRPVQPAGGPGRRDRLPRRVVHPSLEVGELLDRAGDGQRDTRPQLRLPAAGLDAVDGAARRARRAGVGARLDGRG